MNSDDKRLAEVFELVGDLFTSGLDEKRHARLDQLMAEDEQALNIYVEYLDMHTELALESHGTPAQEALAESLAQQIALDELAAGTTEESSADDDAPSAEDQVRTPRRRSFWQGAAATLTRREVSVGIAVGLMYVVATLVTMHMMTLRDRSTKIAKPEQAEQLEDSPANSESVARLVRTLDAKWIREEGDVLAASGERKIKSGMKLHVGDRLQLGRGVAEIKFADKTEVILQGPAEFEIGGKRGGRLERGNLTARVLVAGGTDTTRFTIDTPWAKVVDLGTEFGVRVAAGKTHVRVYDGRVNVIRYGGEETGDDAVELAEGQATAVGEGGEFSEVTIAANGAPAFIRWLPEGYDIPPGLKTDEYISLIKKDKPVAYWPLDDRNEGVLKDVIGERVAFPYGSLRSPDTEAEFREAGTLLFDGKSAYAKAAYDAKFNSPAFTIEAWVRPHPVDPLGVGHRAVFSSRDDDATNGIAGHVLYVTPENRWGFWFGASGSERGASGSWQQFVGSPVRLARWSHVAIMFAPKDHDQEAMPLAGKMRMFVNGQLSAEASHHYRPNERQGFVLGGVFDKNEEPNYLFHGNLAHVAVYDRVLADKEIHSHFHAAIGASLDPQPADEEDR